MRNNKTAAALLKHNNELKDLLRRWMKEIEREYNTDDRLRLIRQTQDALSQ